MPTLEIIGLPQSNFVWAARIACAQKGVAHVSVPAQPHSADVSAIHPLGRIPVLRHGEFVLAESGAIARYVDDAFEGPDLMPRNAQDRARAEQWLSTIVTSSEPVLVRRYLFAYMFPATSDGAPDRAAIDGVLPEVERHLAMLERAVDSGHVGGDDFTLADAFLAPILFYLRNAPETGERIGRSPALASYLERQLARPSVRDTMPPAR